MRARNMISGAAFGPPALKVLDSAFAEAWAAIADDYQDDERDAARTRLAKAVLTVAKEDPSCEAIRDAALRVVRGRQPG